MKLTIYDRKQITSKHAFRESIASIILDAALEVFSAYGFRGSTIDQIAEKAGMSKPNLLYYFPRKDDIYKVTVLEKTLEDWLAPFKDIDPAGDPVEELRKYTIQKLKMSAQQPERSQLFANEILHGATFHSKIPQIQPEKAGRRKGRRHRGLDRRRQARPGGSLSP